MVKSALGGTISGNGVFTKKCHAFFEKRFRFPKVLLTTSCTDALEMSAILCGIAPGDEVIMPSFTFMSTANAFLLRGARIVFADTLPGYPNIDPDEIEKNISPRTKAIVVVHYAGVACDMDRIMEIARKNNLWVVEDAAHAIDSYYKGRPLGSIGHLGTFSFHETKNIISGEGGLLIINHPEFISRAEIIWEKGTNRAAFFRGEVEKYNWVDIGSSFLPSDAVAGFLYTQLQLFDRIQKRRKAIWHYYYKGFAELDAGSFLRRPEIPSWATVNGNLFFVTTRTPDERDRLISFLKEHGIQAVFHYQPLHTTTWYKDKHDGRALPNTDRFSGTILRMPFFNTLRKKQIRYIIGKISTFFNS